MNQFDSLEAERLVNTYSDLILRLSYTYLKSTQGAEDICQTVFWKLLTGGKAFDSPSREKAWMIRTAVNACKDELRDSACGDTYTLSTAYDYTELYETADGVAVAIETKTSNLGKLLFWAEFSSGSAHFSMIGTQMELEDIHAVLGSLNLSALCEYTAE